MASIVTPNAITSLSFPAPREYVFAASVVVIGGARFSNGVPSILAGGATGLLWAETLGGGLLAFGGIYIGLNDSRGTDEPNLGAVWILLVIAVLTLAAGLFEFFA